MQPRQKSYLLIDSVVLELKNYRGNVDNEFQICREFAFTINKDVCIEPFAIRLSKMFVQIQPKC